MVAKSSANQFLCRKLNPWGPVESFLIIGATEIFFVAKECYHSELLVFLCFKGDFLYKQNYYLKIPQVEPCC